MKYVPKYKGIKIGLFSDSGIPPYVPKGMKIRFDTSRTHAEFQFFDGKNAVSPILIQLEDDENNRYIATTRVGERVVIDLEKRLISMPIFDRLENVYIGVNGEIIFDPMSGKTEPYVLDKKRFKTPFEKGYLLKTLAGVRDSSGKCAIFDVYDRRLITDFVLDARSYDIVGALNLSTQAPNKDYLIVQTIPDEKETTDESAKKFIIVSEQGKVAAELISQKYLWNVDNTEKQPDGSEKTFSYVAFAEVDDKNVLKTRVLKIDIDTGELVHEMEVPMLAEKSIQPSELFIFSPDGRLVLISAHPEIKESKGAYILNADGTVETLLENVNTKIEYTHHYKKGSFLTYSNPENVGKVALNAKARTFDISRTEFADLARRYFGASSASELRPKLQRIEEQVASSGKKKPTGGGPSGGEGPTGFGG